MSSQTLLIPIEFPDPDPLPSTFVGGFTTCKVLLLGIYETSSDLDEETRQRQEIEAKSTLYSLANQFLQSGDTAEVELVMDEDVADAATTVAKERDVDAVMTPNPIATLGRLLIPVTDTKFAQPIADFVGTMNQDVIVHTTLLNVVDDESEVEAGEQLLSEVREQLVAADFPDASIETNVVVSDDPSFAISQAATGDDLIIMGETEDPPQDRVFGKTYDSVADQTELPVVVVRE